MPDTIHIERLKLNVRIGVPDEEQSHPQKIEVCISLEPRTPFGDLGDEIEKAVDYYSVCDAVKHLAGDTLQRPRRLIETLAGEIAALLLERFAVRAVSVELRKFILPDTEYVSVRLRRESCVQA